MTGIPSGELLLMLSENITNDWYDLGIYLRLEIGPLDGIRDSVALCKPKHKAFEMLKLWIKGNGDNATVEVLAEALRKASRVVIDTAEIRIWRHCHWSAFVTIDV